MLVGQKLHKISSFFLSKGASFNSKYAVSSNGILAFFVECLGEINISKKDDRLFGVATLTLLSRILFVELYTLLPMRIELHCARCQIKGGIFYETEKEAGIHSHIRTAAGGGDRTGRDTSRGRNRRSGGRGSPAVDRDHRLQQDFQYSPVLRQSGGIQREQHHFWAK
ncbi:hypothetical protein [Bittarella sp. HCP28S3_D9]|uniref:hypothetical protein n=1 Tax=Bittarella sp. HCP28S3_D9 TaxID=3440253 RepID=UPI003F88BAF8